VADKTALIEKIREGLRAELAVAERLARDTADAANHPEARPENDKDTRKVELSYLAAGQAARARELEAAISMVGSIDVGAHRPEEPLRLGSLATLDSGDKTQRVFLSPVAGGMKIRDEDGEISVVTSEAPLGRELMGKSVGESFELKVAGRSRDVEIVAAE
jgi:transcription elongation GreA/GreB family factor